jgi:hypothetical protein
MARKRLMGMGKLRAKQGEPSTKARQAVMRKAFSAHSDTRWGIFRLAAALRQVDRSMPRE